MSFVFHSKLPMTQKYANHSLFLFVCGSSLNLAIATTTFPTTTIFFFPCLFSISLWHGSVPMIENCDCHVSNFPYVGTMLNGTILRLFLHFIVAWVCPWSRTLIVLLSISHLWEPCWMAQFSASFSTSLWHGCAHDQELWLSCYQFPICGNHVEWRSSHFPISFCYCFLDLNQLWQLSDSQLTGISLALVKQCLCK